MSPLDLDLLTRYVDHDPRPTPITVAELREALDGVPGDTKVTLPSYGGFELARGTARLRRTHRTGTLPQAIEEDETFALLGTVHAGRSGDAWWNNGWQLVGPDGLEVPLGVDLALAEALKEQAAAGSIRTYLRDWYDSPPGPAAYYAHACGHALTPNYRIDVVSAPASVPAQPTHFAPETTVESVSDLVWTLLYDDEVFGHADPKEGETEVWLPASWMHGLMARMRYETAQPLDGEHGRPPNMMFGHVARYVHGLRAPAAALIRP